MSTTSSMLNEEFGFVKYDEDILTKINLFTSEEAHDELTCNCNYTNNYNNNNNGIKTKLYNNNNNSNGNDEDHNALQFQVVDDNGDDLNNNNDDKSCAVLQQSINDDCSTAQSSSLIQQNSNEITTRQRSQQITCSTITTPSTETTNQVSSCYQQQHQLSLKNNININKNNNKSDCDIKHEVDKNITSGADDSLLIRRRQSYLVISIDYHKKIEEQIDECDNKSYENRKRRPTLQLGNLEIIPTENPILNDRRLSQISSLELFNNQNKKKRLSFIERMSALVTDPKDGGVVTIHDLPMTFQVKYLGHCPAKGLWGIKHTRGPVDTMVKVAKNLPPGQILPIVRVTISTKGITITQQVNNKRIENCYAIETISYGVQDLVYTRVFSMIVVYENMKDQHPFECHAFVCESRNSARRLTYALAAAFQDYSKRVQETMKDDPSSPVKKKFAIDLRTPEEIQEDIEAETEA